jgi:hypothetical protein
MKRVFAWLTRRLSGLAAAFLLTLAAAGSASAVTLYALSVADRELYAVNSDNLGSPQRIGTLAGFGPLLDPANLATASASHLYMTDRANSRLLTVDRFTAEIVASVPVDVSLATQPRGLDLSPEGILYAVTAHPGNWNLQTLRIIDPLTGSTTAIAPLSGAAGVEAIAFGPDGTLYAVGSPTDLSPSNTLYTLNRTTGQLAMIATMSPPGGGMLDVDDLAFGPDGFLYGADSEAGLSASLYQIDPSSGALSNLGSTGVLELNGLAIVPIPAAAWLLGGALVALGVLKRRTPRT